MIRLHDERRFECPPDQLCAIWRDPAFQEARSAHLGTLEARCTVDGDTVVLEETRDTGWKPPLYVTRMTTVWRGLEARWTLERLAGPGDAGAEGTIAITARRGGCVLSLDGTLEVRVPVFGRMIERLARRALVAEKQKEAAFVSQWIQTISDT